MRKLIARLRNQKGVTMIEYTLLAGLISIAALILIQATGTSVQGIFTAISDALSAAVPPAAG